MILELATFNIQPGQETAFEYAFAKARRILPQAKGYMHIGDVRAMRGFLQDYFQTPPEVGHYFPHHPISPQDA